MNTTPLTLNGASYLVDDRLADFEILKKESSNVDFFGIDASNAKIYVQFKGGTGSYMYSDVSPEVLSGISNAESIGKFIAANIVKKFEAVKFDERLVKSAELTEPSF